MSAGGATKSAELYVCIIIRIALRVGVEFIFLLGEVCHVTNCDNSEHAFVNKGDSGYFVCSSWNICILVDSFEFFIVCPWIILNIVLECYSSTRWRTVIYSWRLCLLLIRFLLSLTGRYLSTNSFMAASMLGSTLSAGGGFIKSTSRNSTLDLGTG